MSIQKQQSEINPIQDLEEFREYLYERENAQATISKYLTDVNTFIKFLGNNYKIDKRRIMEYKEWLAERYAVSSVNSMLVALNQFLEFRGISSYQVKRIKMQKRLFMEQKKEMTKEEYLRLKKAAKQNKKEQLVMGMEVLAETGARVSELSFFTVERIKRGQIEIFNKGKHRIILISDNLRIKLLLYASLNKIKKGMIFVTRNGKSTDRSNFWREMKALHEMAEVDASKVFPHNLRHLFARMYYKKTGDLAGLADLLGHSSLDITRIYTSSTSESYKKQLEELGMLIS